MEVLWTIILHHIPEAFLFAYSGLGLVGVHLSLKRLVPFALVFGVIVHALRVAIFPWHVVALMAVQAVAQRYYFHVSWGASLAAVSISLILLNAGEALLALALFLALQISLDDILTSPLLSLLMGWTTLIPLLIAAVAVGRWGWVLIPLHSGDAPRAGGADEVSGHG